MKIRIKVPASSANMGPGFDSLGIALGLYNTIEVSETGSGLSIATIGNQGYVPQNENNLIYKSMKIVFDECGFEPSGIKIVQRSNIPMTRGMGSSSACIIGGMLGANIIAGRPFSYGEILNFATNLEGHPDNVTPALFGGFCTSVYEDGKVYFTTNKLVNNLKFAVMTPDYFVATRKSRTVVPSEFSKEDVIFNISRASTLVSAMLSGRADLLKVACGDRLHQQYRKEYIGGMDDIFKASYEMGSCATYLSGSGPTILSILDGNYKDFAFKMNDYFKAEHSEWKCRILDIDNVGAIVSTLD